MNFNNSVEHLQKTKELIPLASQTFSKSYTQCSVGASPLFIERGEGSHVWDLDGNEYIDWTFGLASVILGHAFPAVNEAVKKQIDLGNSFSLPGKLEYDLAKLLCDLIPGAEMLRFGRNGSDATAGAVRAARAITKREMIACSGYHGWQDWFIGSTVRNAGVPKSTCDLVKTFDYNKIDSLTKVLNENPGKFAAVILEPVGVIWPEEGFLEAVKEITHKHGALLIFDEIVTGFRLNLGGAQKEFGVIPDIAAFGKSMANGFPVSAVVGKKEYMQIFEDIFFSFTFGGELSGLAAAIATVKFMMSNPVSETLKKNGLLILEGTNNLIKKHGLENKIEVRGYPERHIIIIKDEQGKDDWIGKTFFQEQAALRGVIFSGGHNISYSTTEADIIKTLNIYDEVMELFKATSRLEIRGTLVQPVFRKA